MCYVRCYVLALSDTPLLSATYCLRARTPPLIMSFGYAVRNFMHKEPIIAWSCIIASVGALKLKRSAQCPVTRCTSSQAF